MSGNSQIALKSSLPLSIDKLNIVSFPSPPRLTGIWQKRLFIVRQFGGLQRAQLHLSTPIFNTEQLKPQERKNTKTQRQVN